MSLRDWSGAIVREREHDSPSVLKGGRQRRRRSLDPLAGQPYAIRIVIALLCILVALAIQQVENSKQQEHYSFHGTVRVSEP